MKVTGNYVAPLTQSNATEPSTTTQQKSIPAKRVVNTNEQIPAKKTRLLNKEQASNIITKNFRKMISDKSYAHMFSEGEIWKESINNAKGFATMQKISSENISMLSKELAPLSEKEIVFFDRISRLGFTATHATNGNIINQKNTLTLFSKKKLEERNTALPWGSHAASPDIKTLGNDDFIFFAIEPGTGGLKKSSRFGKTMYAINFNMPVFSQVSWISLQEQIFSETGNTKNHISNISEEAHNILSFKELSLKENMFLVKDFKTGLALSLIKKFRELPLKDQDNLLSANDNDSFNSIINGIYRPELKVPRHIFIKDGDYNINNIKMNVGGIGEYVPTSELDNYDFIYSNVIKDARVLYYASERLKNDFSIVSRALMNDSDAIFYIEDQLEKNLSLAKQIIAFSPVCLKNFPKSLTDNEEIIRHAIQQDATTLQYASERLRDNDNIVSEAISKKPEVLKYASERIQKENDLK
ncbi:DUF4116 domain-containing protein [Escherichia marmotae]|uniref:DUF4116 domain-containing protein n=1 Tax=Escherichia marmotae TaxID=1499973 RepID=UPI000907BE20|nr:DUF4116 domain-containing protein [Escherichia marmotae]AUT25706.1 DUF4116 domain-containing protein [Escherichia marmotae]EGF7347496.1 DUF4116 domain-containing protein [Escherichia coli]EGF7412454.1 DUF4116 domain-containing protein [Escherichia coli]EGF7453603.1 DUF4116 domain-containing protein [Escherichia coli]